MTAGNVGQARDWVWRLGSGAAGRAGGRFN